jgi:hypothetical protein
MNEMIIAIAGLFIYVIVYTHINTQQHRRIIGGIIWGYADITPDKCLLIRLLWPIYLVLLALKLIAEAIVRMLGIILEVLATSIF